MARLLRQRLHSPAGTFGLGLACLCSCVLLCGCVEMPAAGAAAPRAFPTPGAIHAPVEIGVLIAGWHSGIVLPAGELGTLDSLTESSPRARYLSFGWGNRRFYMAAHPGSGDAFAALFRSSSVLFVQAAAAPAGLSGADEQIHWLCADHSELSRLDAYIERSLFRTRGHPVSLGPGPLPNSRFYISTAHYSAAHTCNTWTVAALQYAGLPVKASGVLFASQVGRRVGQLRVCPAP